MLSAQAEIIKLMVAYTLVGAFIFTVIVTCLSLVGWIKFADKKQQNTLFGALIVELVVISVGSFGDILNLSPSATTTAIEEPLVRQAEELQESVTEQRQQTEEATVRLEVAALVGLKPEAVMAATRLIDAAKAQGVVLRVVSGYRSLEAQQALYDQGRTTPGPMVTTLKIGTHNTGFAFDVVPEVDGSMQFDAPAETWQQIGAIGKDLGLVWGGDFQGLPDFPHFETTGARAALELLRETQEGTVP